MSAAASDMYMIQRDLLTF